MTEHLPECHYIEDTGGVRYGWNDCICDELRACEQRVAEETEAAMMESFYWKPSPPHDQHYFADNICAYCVGYSEALSAAREAVKHLQHSDDCYYAEGVLCHCEIKRVITAIDALRKEPQ